MTRKHFLTFITVLLLVPLDALHASDAPAKTPNILLILADDLGYGDIGCYGATKIKTPNIDRLAREGMRFTNAYTPGSVCSPTRYGLMTGRYVWRTTAHPPTGVLAPSAPLIIEQDRMTLASLFQRQGYATGCLGKWHLGFGTGEATDRYDWSQDEIKPGPCEVGFDYFYGMAANVANQPRIYIENHRFVGRKPDDVVTMVGRSEIKPWSPDAEYKEDHVAGDIAKKAVEFLERSREKPFFLYFATNIVHNNITPASEQIGKSQCGPYGDFIQELDYHVGLLLDTLEKGGLLDNTIVLFTSDNGGVVAENDRLVAHWRAKQAGHAICGNLRGRKASIYEGGFRVPLIVRWPGVVQPDSTNHNVICLTDVLTTFAEALGLTVPAKAGEDSFSFLATLKSGEAIPATRQSVILQSFRGLYAIRKGPWKLIEKIPDPVADPAARKITPKPRKDPENENQLFNLADDPSETTNVWDKNPQVVKELTELLHQIKANGRSHP